MKVIKNANLLPQEMTESMLHCKIMTVYHYLLLNNISIDYRLLYLLGVSDLLQFGVQKYNDTFLWFLNPYNIFCDKELMDVFHIELNKPDRIDINKIKECIDNNNILAIYYDGNIYVNREKRLFMRKKSVDSYSEDIYKSLVNNSSLGLIIGYDDAKECFVLNIIDQGGKNISIKYNTFLENRLYEEVYFMKLSQEVEKNVDYEYMALKKLYEVSKEYLKQYEGYMINDEKKICGTLGCSSLLALKQELLQSIKLLEDDETREIVKERLCKKLDIMRLFFLKGSNTGFRKELAIALDYLGDIYNEDKLKKDGKAIKEIGNIWREFSRYLYNVNNNIYNKHPVKFISKLIGIIDELYKNEVQVFSSIKSNTKSMLN
ncbi:hypothetical protein [Vallitalea guaymasensis]|uniref:hypothetical protein n=1 Tax=Vallitalea guaymasensis TaxID=1185412 RepID=UPI002352918A|nr:hypothetical protein [Vallitalea guaymasensis]